MRLLEFLNQNLIKTPLESYEKEEVLAEILELLVSQNKVTDRDMAYDALIEREDKGSTGIGEGIAIPHTRIDVVDGEGIAVALGISPEGIDFEAIDDEPVYILFMIIGSKEDVGLYMNVLAETAKLLQQQGIFNKLVTAESPEEVWQILVKEAEKIENE